MNNYEILYIIKSKLEDEAKNTVIKKFEDMVTSSGGTVDKIDKWGTKKFAYPIDYMEDGYYVLMNFSSSSELPKELERQMRISDDIVRYMVIKK